MNIPSGWKHPEEVANVRRILVEGSAHGAPPAEMARKIKQTVGITEGQATALVRYEQALRDLDPTALDRELRNKRADGRVRAAIESGTPLSDDAVDTLVDDYRNNAVRHP